MSNASQSSLLVAVVLTLSLAASANDGPVTVSGEVLPRSCEIALIDGSSSQLTLRGAHKLVWKWVFDVYIAALYLPAGTAAGSEPAVAASPKRIVFHYRRSFTSADLIKATDGTLGQDVSAAERATYAATQARFNAFYNGVEKGDLLVVDHLPGGWLVLTRNGIELGRVQDEVFAQAMFRIWIGSKPFNEDLRDGLLEQR